MAYKIGELARHVGCRVVTIRYYEKEGLLRSPERTAGNYRLYDEADVERLRFIRQCRLHGMALHEIRELLSFQDQPRQSCDWITALVQRHLANVDTQIAALTHLREHLASLLHACAGGKAADCGILAQLRKGENCRRCEEMQQQQDAAAGVRKQDAAEAVPTGKAGRKSGRSA